MQLEGYFDFLAEDDIRVKGTRIGIESVLYEYIHRAQNAEAIAQRFRTLSLEQVYATILYYLRNKEKVGAYLADYLEYCREARKAYEKNLPPVVVRLRQLLAEREAAKQEARIEESEIPHGSVERAACPFSSRTDKRTSWMSTCSTFDP